MKQVDTVIHHLKIGYFKESISFYLHYHIYVHICLNYLPIAERYFLIMMTASINRKCVLFCLAPILAAKTCHVFFYRQNPFIFC